MRLPGFKLVGSADTQYRSSRYVGFDYTAEERQTPTWQTNAELTLTPDEGRWSVHARGRPRAPRTRGAHVTAAEVDGAGRRPRAFVEGGGSRSR